MSISLIEVMLSILLLTFALFHAMQTKVRISAALQLVNDKQIVMLQIFSILERLKANEISESCSNEISSWKKETETILPEGLASMICQEKQCEISVSWKRKQRYTISKKIGNPFHAS